MEELKDEDYVYIALEPGQVIALLEHKLAHIEQHILAQEKRLRYIHQQVLSGRWEYTGLFSNDFDKWLEHLDAEEC